jgi:hypothetical protein
MRRPLFFYLISPERTPTLLLLLPFPLSCSETSAPLAFSSGITQETLYPFFSAAITALSIHFVTICIDIVALSIHFVTICINIACLPSIFAKDSETMQNSPCSKTSMS